jgi:hypothetical protein
MLGQGRSLLEAVVEPAPGFVAMHNTVEGVASYRIRGEQVAEADLFLLRISLRFVVCASHQELAGDVGNSSRCT